MVLLKLPTGEGKWQVADQPCRKYFANQKIFLRVSTGSFSCWAMGCCLVRAAFHLRRFGREEEGDSKKELKLIVYPSEVKFPFPREANCVGGGTMKLEGFGIVKPQNEAQTDIILKSDTALKIGFKIGFSFQSDPTEIMFDLDPGKPDGLIKEFKHGGHFVFNLDKLSQDDFKKEAIHVWIAQEGDKWENTYLGMIPIADVQIGQKWTKGVEYFPDYSGKQKKCCFYTENTCKNDVHRINADETKIDAYHERPPLLIGSIKFEAAAYCRFCGNSLCESHTLKNKMFGVDIGELCDLHSKMLHAYIRKEDLANQQADQGISKGKAADSSPAFAQKQEDFQGERFALTLGMANYNDGPYFSQMTVCKRDAEAMETQLNCLSFKVVQRVENASKEEFEKKFSKWVETMEKSMTKCVALFHASCHGLEVDNENYLVPIDAKGFDDFKCKCDPSKGNTETCISCFKDEVKRQCISLQELLDQLIRRLPAGSIVIFFLDCCRENPSTKSVKLNRNFRRTFAKLQISAVTKTYVGYATQKGKLAEASSERYTNLSPFTFALVECLKNPAIVSCDLDKLFRSVRAFVENITVGRMIPDTQSNLTEGFRFKLSRRAMGEDGKKEAGGEGGRGRGEG